MRRSLFRRRPSAAAPAANGADIAHADQKDSRRHFGRIGSLQHVRPRHDDDEPVEKRAASDEAISARRHRSPDRFSPPPAPELDLPANEPAAAAAATAAEESTEQQQPRLSKTRSSKSKRRSSARRTREREHPHHSHHRENRYEHRERQDEATMLAELNKMLETLTTRELQLSLRVDKADEAVRDALARKAKNDTESTRKRALCALKQKRHLERSLSATTEQSDRVLRLLGQNVLIPLSERIEAGVERSRLQVDAANADAAALASPGVDFDDCDDDQILREIDATIAADDDEKPRVVEPSSRQADSADWLAEVREADKRRSYGREAKVRREVAHDFHERVVAERVEEPRFDPRADEFDAVPEPAALEKPRPSREKRESHAQPPPKKTSRLPRGATFSRRRKGDKK